MSGTYATGEIYLLADDVLPYTVNHLDVSGVLCQGGNVGNACIHVSGTHGMSHSFVLLKYGLMAL